MCESCICRQKGLILIWRKGEATCGKCGHGYGWEMKPFKFDTQVLKYCIICGKMTGLACPKCGNRDIYTTYHTKSNKVFRLDLKNPVCSGHKYRKVPKK